MMAKPMKTLELHYPMIQFLIIVLTTWIELEQLQVFESESLEHSDVSEKTDHHFTSCVLFSNQLFSKGDRCIMGIKAFLTYFGSYSKKFKGKKIIP